PHPQHFSFCLSLSFCLSSLHSSAPYPHSSTLLTPFLTSSIFYEPPVIYCYLLQYSGLEHSMDDEVCGCPLVHNVFEVTDDFCCLPKCFCNLHYCWAKLRRAEVDLECVRAVGCKAESEVRTAIMNQTGLLALMLHQATQHDPLTTDLRSRVDS
ncbi:hypothetical protein FD755_025793, partial [Muntiacus reevesi]